MITRDDIVAFEPDWDLYSDAHKDAFGVRPSVFPKFQGENEFYQSILNLQEIANSGVRMQEKAYDLWIQDVHKTANAISNKVADVVRWQFQAAGLDIDRLGDREAFCYDNGFPFSYARLIGKIR